MHAIVKICSLLLLTVATKADQTTTKALAPKSDNQLSSVPPHKWAQRDWVPERNRRFNARNIPIGQGELEPEHVYRRMPKRFHIRRHRMVPRVMMRANNHLDQLNRYILNDYKRIRNRKHMKKLKGVRTKHLSLNKKKVAGKHSRKSQSQARKHTRKSHKAVKMFPKDIHITEDFKFKYPNNEICASTKLKSHDHYFLLPWWYYYCYKYQERESNNNFQGSVYMPLYRQAVDHLKRYKKMKEERVRAKETLLSKNSIVG